MNVITPSGPALAVRCCVGMALFSLLCLMEEGPSSGAGEKCPNNEGAVLTHMLYGTWLCGS